MAKKSRLRTIGKDVLLASAMVLGSFSPARVALEDIVFKQQPSVIASEVPLVQEKPRKDLVLPTEYVREQVSELTKQAAGLKGRDLYEHITREQMLKMSPYRDLILQSAKQEGIDPYFMLGLSFTENAQVDLFVGSESGCTGLFQFCSETAERYDHEINRDIDERRDPTVTIPAAAKYLGHLKRRYGNDLPALLTKSYHGTAVVKDSNGNTKTITPPNWYAQRVIQKRDFIKRHNIKFDKSVPLFTDLRKKSVAYPVEEGDSVHSLASRFNVDERVLRELNPQVVNYRARLNEGTEVYVPKRAIKEAKYTALKLAI